MKYRIESLPDVDSPREDVQLINVWVEGGRGSMGPMHVIGLSNLAKALSCMAVVQEGPRRSQVTIAGAAGDLALLSEIFNSALIQCKVGLKEALRERECSIRSLIGFVFGAATRWGSSVALPLGFTRL